MRENLINQSTNTKSRVSEHERELVFVIVCGGGRNAKVERVTCMYGRKETPQQVLTLARLLT